MASLETELGYGKRAIVETEVFTRILAGHINDDEELRREAVSYDGNGFEFVGIAPSGSRTDLDVWCVVRATYENGRKTRLQYRPLIRWDQRGQGWL